MDVMDAIRIRRSVRDYDSREIPDDVMERMKDALRLAPSACNFQPWRFVIITGAEMKKKIAAASCGQKFIAGAPVVIVGVGFPHSAYKNMGGYGNSVDVDIAIALDHLTLAAAAEGLGTCWIGAFDEKGVKELIGARDGVRIVALTPLGYPADPALLHPVKKGRRKPAEEIFAYQKLG